MLSSYQIKIYPLCLRQDVLREINNRPEINPDFTFSESIRMDNINYNYEWINNRLFGGWVQHWANVAQDNGRPNYYMPDRRIDDEMWMHFYQNVLKNLERTQALLLDISDGDENNPEIRSRLAIVRIYETLPFEKLTAAYGDVPYFQGARGMDGHSFPEYDPQSQIYPEMIQRLDQNIAMLSEQDISFGDADYFYGGNVDNWRKLGNAIKLRLGMRLTNVDPELAQQVVTQAMQGPLISSDAESALLGTVANNGPDETAHPITREMRAPDIKSRPGMHLVNMLKERDDPRLPLIAEPTLESKGVFAQTGDPDDLVFEGIRPNMTVEQYDDLNLTRVSEVALDIWANEDLNVPVHIFTHSEVLFLQAEAALYGWGASEEDAEAFFREGIRSALQMPPYHISDQEVTAYLDEHGTLSGSAADKLEQIHDQKYISLFTKGLEAYFEWRRTGFPTLDPGDRTANVTNGVIPRRAYYSQVELSLNGANLQTAISRQGEDHPLTRMWIDPENAGAVLGR
jgi:hypothetical protein